MLEFVHDAGYVYNDLKLDNLMFDYCQDIKGLALADHDFFQTINVNLIDFGYSTSYLRKNSNEHIAKKMVDVFRGNIYFSSLS